MELQPSVASPFTSVHICSVFCPTSVVVWYMAFEPSQQEVLRGCWVGSGKGSEEEEPIENFGTSFFCCFHPPPGLFHFCYLDSTQHETSISANEDDQPLTLLPTGGSSPLPGLTIFFIKTPGIDSSLKSTIVSTFCSPPYFSARRSSDSLAAASPS